MRSISGNGQGSDVAVLEAPVLPAAIEPAALRPKSTRSRTVVDIFAYCGPLVWQTRVNLDRDRIATGFRAAALLERLSRLHAEFPALGSTEPDLVGMLFGTAFLAANEPELRKLMRRYGYEPAVLDELRDTAEMLLASGGDETKGE